MDNPTSETLPLKLDGRTVGTATLNDDGSLTYDVTDPETRQKLNRAQNIGDFSIDERPRRAGKTTEAEFKAAQLGSFQKPKPTIYIAGPMSGLPELNYDAFHQAAKDLRAAGFTVLNPAENQAPCMNPTWKDWMRLAIAQLIQADAIALLPGWMSSKGAKVENDLGHAIGLDVRPIRSWLPSQEQQLAVELAVYNYKRVPGGYTGNLADGRPIAVVVNTPEESSK